MYCTPLIIVARPLAVPIPRPLIALGPTRLNLKHTMARKSDYKFPGENRRCDEMCIEPLTWEHSAAYPER